MQNYNLSPEMIQALAIIRDGKPVKRGTLFVTCKGFGYGYIAREVWKELLDKGWLVCDLANPKHGQALSAARRESRYKPVRLSTEAAHYLKYGTLPPTLEERNVCTLCKGSKGWQGEKYFVTCQRCNGDGLYHG